MSNQNIAQNMNTARPEPETQYVEEPPRTSAGRNIAAKYPLAFAAAFALMGLLIGFLAASRED